MMQYKVHADAGSLYNTPPAYGIYICGKVFQWLKKRGGLAAMKEYNEKKAAILYDYLDQSKLFKGTVEKNVGEGGAEVLLMGECSHHNALMATMKGRWVITVFHSNSERGFLWQRMRSW